MKRLKKGFTLIELLVVIAIIGILATTLAPKLREQLAKAKDSKAIALLGAARTASEVILIDKLVTTTAATISITVDEIRTKLDSKSQDLLAASTGEVTVGGSMDSSGDIDYGGTVTVGIVTSTSGAAVTTAQSSSAVSDDVQLALKEKSPTNNKSTEGKEWVTY